GPALIPASFNGICQQHQAEEREENAKGHILHRLVVRLIGVGKQEQDTQKQERHRHCPASNPPGNKELLEAEPSLLASALILPGQNCIDQQGQAEEGGEYAKGEALRLLFVRLTGGRRQSCNGNEQEHARHYPTTCPPENAAEARALG